MKILAVSPHLDDAVFSAGATLSAHARAGDEVTVLTCLTGNFANPTGFALACQLDKGLAPDVDYMALRQAEDRDACAAIGADALHWDFLEAPHRGYEDAPSLFGEPLAGDRLAEVLEQKLAEHLRKNRYDRIYGPWGVGNHVDHMLVRKALQAVASDAVWWEDFPYALREDAPPAGLMRRPVAPEDVARKVEGALCYTTQIPFQFGSPEQARRVLSEWQAEGLSR